MANRGSFVEQLVTVLGEIGEISKGSLVCSATVHILATKLYLLSIGNEQLESVATTLCSFLQTVGFTQ